MSGILSLVREAIGLYAPGLTPTENLFWTCVRIAFIFAMAAGWFRENRRVKELQRQLEDKYRAPEFSGTIEFISAAPSEIPGSAGVVLTISGYITNPHGPSSATVAWRMKLEFLDGRVMLGRVPVFPARSISLQRAGGAPQQSITLLVSDLWPQKGIQPVTTGGVCKGWFLSVFPEINMRDVQEKCPNIVLEFEDVVAHKVHRIEKAFPNEYASPIFMGGNPQPKA